MFNFCSTFTSNSAVFVGGVAKIFWPSTHGTIATPLDYYRVFDKKKTKKKNRYKYPVPA